MGRSYQDGISLKPRSSQAERPMPPGQAHPHAPYATELAVCDETIEQAEAFREQVEHYTDAERVILADAYQALLRYGPLPHPSSPLVIYRFRDPRAGVLGCSLRCEHS
jgi:hypothetical protein